MLQRILAATDFSGAAQIAVARAARLAAEAGARLEVVHVARPLSRSLLAWLRREPEVAAAIEAAHQRLDDVVASARRHGADVRGHLVTGAPVTALAATARRFRANLVVVGARGALRLRDQMLGTTAERLIEQQLSGDVQASARALPDAPRLRRHGPRGRAGVAVRAPARAAVHGARTARLRAAVRAS